MRYYYKDSKGNLFNFKSERFVKYKKVTETITLTDEEGNPFLDENGELITEMITKTIRDGLEEGYTQITEEEFNSILQSRVPKPTEEQKAKMEKERKIAELKKKLSETDYIVLKIAEAQADNDTEKVSALKTTYASELEERKEAREKINELEVSQWQRIK